MAGWLNLLIKHVKKLKFNCIFYSILYAVAILPENITTTFGLSSQDHKKHKHTPDFQNFFQT